MSSHRIAVQWRRSRVQANSRTKAGSSPHHYRLHGPEDGDHHRWCLSASADDQSPVWLDRGGAPGCGGVSLRGEVLEGGELVQEVLGGPLACLLEEPQRVDEVLEPRSGRQTAGLESHVLKDWLHCGGKAAEVVGEQVDDTDELLEHPKPEASAASLLRDRSREARRHPREGKRRLVQEPQDLLGPPVALGFLRSLSLLSRVGHGGPADLASHPL